MNDFYVIGNPVKQSKSPLLFNYIFKKLNIQVIYGSHQLDDAKGVSDFIDKCIKNKVTGINITMPFKESASIYATILDETAKITKAINCMHFINNQIIAYNNDYYGFLKLAEMNNISFNKSNNIVIGSGGSARSIIWSLIKNKASTIHILARNATSVYDLIKDMSLIQHNTKLKILSNKSDLTNCNLINCTPIGMLIKTNVDILKLIPMIRYNSIIDINYNIHHDYFNFKTLKKINGKSMFIFQALKTLDIWFDSNISDKLNYKELEKIIC